MRRFLPFAALLGVAFVLGCQDVGTGVVASDGAGPQFAKKDCGANPTHRGCKEEPPTYTVELGPDRPPIVVPPTVLVQGPPEAWGEGR